MYDNLVMRLRCTQLGKCQNCKNSYLEQVEPNLYRERCAAIDAADVIENLSKRDKPMEIKEIHVDEYYCPACGAENNADEGVVYDRYCPECGQRLLAIEQEDY